MTRVRFLFVTLVLLCGLGLVADLIVPDSAMARSKKIAFIDDDWEPSEGKDGEPRYASDPGYEVWIQEALDLTGVDYDVFEIWPDGATDPQVPSLADLSEYGGVLWNCAANDSLVLSPDEMSLLVDYLDLGGKVILSGQGICNDLIRNLADPQVANFFENVLGLGNVILDQELGELMPSVAAAYFAGLPVVTVAYTTLPDSDPALVDLLLPLPGTDTYIDGLFVPPSVAPVATDRYAVRPLHFQSFMFEAIPNADDRAEYMLAEMEWLGLEGTNLYDFMNGTEDLLLTQDTPPHVVEWDGLDERVHYEAYGDTPGMTRLEKYLAPEGPVWTIGVAFMVEESGLHSRVTLIGLDGVMGMMLSVINPVEDPAHFALEIYSGYTGEIIENLDVGTYYRAQVYHDYAAEFLVLHLTDDEGNLLAVRDILTQLQFDKLTIDAAGAGAPGAIPLIGWLDDIWFEGQFDHNGPTAVGAIFFESESVPGGVDLRWATEQPGLEFLLLRGGEEIAFEDFGASFLARDRDPILAGGGCFDYELFAREDTGPWWMVGRESVELAGTNLPALRLSGAFPNPFNPATEIRFHLAEAGVVELAVFDLSGRRLRTLLAGHQQAGPGSASWDGRDQSGRPLASGVYLVRIAGKGMLAGEKIVLLK